MKPYVSPVVALFLLCQVFLIITHVPLVRLLAWIIIAGDMEIFTERGATLYATSPRKKKMTKPSFMAPPEPLDKLLAKKILAPDSDSESDSERSSPVMSTVTELTKLASPFHIPEQEPISSPENDPSLLSITDEEKQILISEANFSLENRPFL